MTCCALDGCSDPDVCQTCRWIGYVVLSCPTQLAEGRCRFVSGHSGICRPLEREARATAPQGLYEVLPE